MFNYRLYIGKWAGIPVYIHATFLLLLLFVCYQSWAAGANWQGIALSVVLVLLFFVCVILHEYGHALMARRFGVSTRDIVMYPIGGVATLERIPHNPVQE